MKKISEIILFLCLLFYPNLTVSSTIRYNSDEIVKATIDFGNKAVTTRNLKEKLQNISHQLKYATIKIKLDYLDDTLERNIANLSFKGCEQLEEDYQKLLKDFGMHQEIEKIEKNGVQLSSITILTKQKNLNQFIKQGYKVSLI